MDFYCHGFLDFRPLFSKICKKFSKTAPSVPIFGPEGPENVQANPFWGNFGQASPPETSVGKCEGGRKVVKTLYRAGGGTKKWADVGNQQQRTFMRLMIHTIGGWLKYKNHTLKNVLRFKPQTKSQTFCVGWNLKTNFKKLRRFKFWNFSLFWPRILF